MTKQELLTKLIEYYETAIKEMPEKGCWIDFLDLKHIQLGVCNCADEVFNIDIYGQQWKDNYYEGISWNWAKVPSEAKDRTEAISLLQIRVDIMKKELTLKEE